VRRAEYIIDRSGIVSLLTDEIRTSTRGRPTNTTNLRNLFVGLFLTIHTRGSATFTDVAEVLANDLEYHDQLRLGVRALKDDDKFFTVTRGDFYNLTKTITARLGYGQSFEDLTDLERAQRHDAVQRITDRLMDVFDLGWPSTMYALDATGLWSWKVGGKQRKDGVGDAFADPANQSDPATGCDPTDTGTGTGTDTDTGPGTGTASTTDTGTGTGDDDDPEIGFESSRPDGDAAWGYKTSRRGSSEMFYGFHEHTLVQVPDVGQSVDDQPPLIRRFEITPANHDARPVSFSLLDRLGAPINDLLVDRLYSNLRYETWKEPLDTRGINQHLDLRADDQGFTESDRLRWVAGHAHCPGTPDALGDIPRPGPNEPHKKVVAFQAQIMLRAQYQMAVHTQLNAKGKERLRCPAQAGQIGCPLRAGTIEAALAGGLPVVETPPDPTRDGEALPACCTQSTVSVRPPVKALKHRQPHDWGAPDWYGTYPRRTYVEGSYGNRKNPNTENLRRGHYRTSGITWVHLIMGLVNASYNLRVLRNWHERTGRGDPNHPLLTPHDRPFAYIAITQAEARQIALKRSVDAA
jgi:hypothetical protein